MTLKKEYVEKEAAIDYLTLNMNWYDEDGDQVDDWGERKAIISDLLAGIPPADVKPVAKGEWICTDDDCNIWMCSVCKEEQILEAGTPRDNSWHFCPNCGADMRKETRDG